MKTYESPIILAYEELAEGVYAASGTPEKDYENDPDCWTLAIAQDQIVAHEGWTTYRVQANHPGTVQHISEKTVVTVVFSKPITNAEFEGFDVQVSGCTVVLTRESHGNSYYSADQFNTLLKVWTDDPTDLSIVSSQITCTHVPNVQGGMD